MVKQCLNFSQKVDSNEQRDKIEIKKGMLFDYQLKTADLYNICNGSGKTLARNYFDEEKYVLHYENLTTLLQTTIKTKKTYIAYQNSINGNG